MRVQQKPFYADLFSKTSPTVLPAIPSLKVAPSPAPVSARPPEDEVKNTRTAPGKEIVLSGKGRALAPLDKTPDSKTDGVALSDPALGKPSALRGIIGNVRRPQPVAPGNDQSQSGPVRRRGYLLRGVFPIGVSARTAS